MRLHPRDHSTFCYCKLLSIIPGASLAICFPIPRTLPTPDLLPAVPFLAILGPSSSDQARPTGLLRASVTRTVPLTPQATHP